MSRTRTTLVTRAGRPRPVARLGAGAGALARLLALCAVATAGAVPLLAGYGALRDVLFDGTSATLHGPYHIWELLGMLLLAGTVGRVRWVARRSRQLVGRWCGVAVPEPYRPAPPAGTADRWQRLSWVLGDPATGRDLLWIGLNAALALFVLLLPLGALAVYAIAYLTLRPHSTPPDDPSLPTPPGPPAAPAAPAAGHPVYAPTAGHPIYGPMHGLLHADGPLFVAWALLCLLLVHVVLRTAPRLLAGYGRLAHRLLGPTREAELAERVDHLAATRTATIDSGAAEMRRIERDLHDGAQARLVAMGMTLNVAEQLFESNPQAALALVGEAKESSAKALAELRDLVRGIHPPVLADRGLVDAVHALALDLPVRAELTGALPARPPAPVESAAYFAVNELLANVSKHAGAGRVWIEIGHTGEALRIGVTDDGRGGADPSRGSGLRGLERRLAAFDGVLAVSSPPGGPTIASLEIPCALSSPKTSSC
ncbi:histidine kinase [Kitasatospora sp. LaBMicrA B282]|uniref:sensor histidine kinase n=1 Tax=Kitasatospora sp. LaBMicrA B282 TaxID=3420949 RepID=UPI003D0C2F3B